MKGYFKIVWLAGYFLMPLMLSSCGETTTASAPKTSKTTKSTNAQDAKAGNSLAINDPKADSKKSCHDKGKAYDRKIDLCSDTLKLAKDVTCDRSGIEKWLSSAGKNITSALDKAMGPADGSSKGEGFVADQCTESLDGKTRVVYLIKNNPGGKEGELIERELSIQL